MVGVDKDPISYILGVAALHIAALSLPILTPLAVGGVMTSLGVSEVEVGLMITAEVLVMGVAAISMAPVIVRVPVRTIALWASVAVAVAHYMSSQSLTLNELYPWRILAGLGVGVLMATNNAVAARGKRPAVLYGIGWMSVYAFTAVFAIAITSFSDQLHHATIYGWLALVMLLFLPFGYALLPRSVGQSQSLRLPHGTLLTGSLLMLTILLIGSAMMAYYAFVERIAMNISGDPTHAGIIVALVQIGGIIGGGLAVSISMRFGTLRPLLIVTGVHAVFVLLATLADSIPLLAAAAFFESVAFIIYTPLFYALVADVDRQGRWAAIGGGMFLLATALGPAAGGYAAGNFGFLFVGVFNVLVAIPAILLYLWIGKRVTQQISPE